jgi:hypothetical protein
MDNSLEAKNLAHNILIDIENNRKDIHLVALQTARLALLLNNQEESKKFSDYAKESGTIEAFLNLYGLIIHELVKNVELDSMYNTKNSKSYELQRQREMLEQLTSTGFAGIKKDPKNEIEKYNRYKKRKSDIISNIYEYAMNVYYQLNFSENVSGIFDAYRNIVDNKLPTMMPNSRDKLDSITKNLQSQNQEDWSNAVHTCRKLLQDFADALYPPSNDKIQKNGKSIDIGKEAYINRLVNYIEDNASSDKFKQITNSNIKYIGERLDAIYEATNKGSHETITSLEEARRYVIYTYMFIGDVLLLASIGNS